MKGAYGLAALEDRCFVRFDNDSRIIITGGKVALVLNGTRYVKQVQSIISSRKSLLRGQNTDGPIIQHERVLLVELEEITFVVLYSPASPMKASGPEYSKWVTDCAEFDRVVLDIHELRHQSLNLLRERLTCVMYCPLTYKGVHTTTPQPAMAMGTTPHSLVIIGRERRVCFVIV